LVKMIGRDVACYVSEWEAHGIIDALHRLCFIAAPGRSPGLF